MRTDVRARAYSLSDVYNFFYENFFLSLMYFLYTISFFTPTTYMYKPRR